MPAQIKIVWIETELSFFTQGGCASRYVRAWALGCFHSRISIWRALTALMDSCVEIMSAPSVA